MEFNRSSRFLLYVVLAYLLNCRISQWPPPVTLEVREAIEKTDCITCFDAIKRLWSGTIETKTIQTDSDVLKVNNIIILNNTSSENILDCCAVRTKTSMIKEKYMEEVFQAIFKNAGIVITQSEKFPTVYIIINKFDTDRICFPSCHHGAVMWFPSLEKRYIYISSEIWIKNRNFVFFTAGSRIYDKFFFRINPGIFSEGLSQFINESFGTYTFESVQQTKKYLINANRSK